MWIYWPLWLLALKTSPRRGELLGIRRKDLDLEKGTLQVHPTVTLLHGTPIIQTPKTAASRRVVRLSADAVTALAKYRTAWLERQLASSQWVDSDLVFSTRDGKPLNPNNVYRNYQAIIEQARIPRINLLGTRHTHTTLALAGGAPTKAVSERLGHSKTSTTVDTYSHVLPDMQVRVVDVIDAPLFCESS